MCRLIPVVGSTIHDPKPDAFDWIRLTARPDRSAVHRYVVSPAFAATGRRDARLGVDLVATIEDPREHAVGVGLVVEQRGPVVGDGGRGLDQQVRPARRRRGSSGSPAASASAAMPSIR